MAKEHFKFDSQEWMAEELIPEMTERMVEAMRNDHGKLIQFNVLQIYCTVWIRVRWLRV